MVTKKPKAVAPAQKKTVKSKKNTVNKSKPRKSGLSSQNIFFIVAVIVVGIILFMMVSKKSDTSTIATTTEKASLDLVSSSSSVAIGDKIQVSLYSNSNEVLNNAVQAIVKYPSDKLQLVNISSNSSAYPIKAVESSTNGTITVSRGVIGGVKNKQLVTDMEFVAKASGNADFSYDKSETFLVSAETNKNLLNNDGYNTTTVEVIK